jgi:hypothetical protein
MPVVGPSEGTDDEDWRHKDGMCLILSGGKEMVGPSGLEAEL